MILKLFSNKAEISLFITLITYSTFSSSTPDNFNIPELIILLGLISLILTCPIRNDKLNKSLIFFFFLSLCFGILNIVDFNLALRDVIPHLFIFLAVSNFKNIRKDFFVNIILASGLIISIRYFLITGFNLESWVIGNKFTFDGFLKLNSDPILFYCTILAFYELINSKKTIYHRMFYAIVFLCSILVPLISVSRGPILIILISILYIIKRKIFLLFIILPFTFIYYQDIYFIIEFFIEKTNRSSGVGKLVEFYDVIVNNININNWPYGVGFGKVLDLGWANYRFSHSAISYYFAKTGFFSFLILLFWVIHFFIFTFFKTPNYFKPIIVFVVFYGFLLNPWYKFMTFWIIISHLIYVSYLNKKT